MNSEEARIKLTLYKNILKEIFENMAKESGKSCFVFDDDCFTIADNALKAKPRIGQWINHNDDHYDWVECSECGYGAEGEITSENGVRFNYCPICGVKMQEVSEWQTKSN